MLKSVSSLPADREATSLSGSTLVCPVVSTSIDRMLGVLLHFVRTLQWTVVTLVGKLLDKDLIRLALGLQVQVSPPLLWLANDLTSAIRRVGK